MAEQLRPVFDSQTVEAAQEAALAAQVQPTSAHPFAPDMWVQSMLTQRERDALDAAPDGILLVDRSGRIVVTNAAMQSISGYERHELEGQMIDTLLPADMHVKHRSYMQGYFANPSRRAMGVGGVGVLWMPRKQGDPVPVDIALGYFGDAKSGIAVAFVRDVTDINQMQQRMKVQATCDTLTGLSNRWQFGQELEGQIRLAQSSGETLALLQLDLDNFKAINDGYGHHAGDLLLKEVALRLQSQLKNQGILARLGGDEFIVLLVGQSAEQAMRWSKQILKSLAKPFNIGGLKLDFGASIGIALYPENAQKSDDLLRFSDMAMYCAKVQGRGHALLYEPSMGQEMAERVLLADRLRIALSSNGLQLHYQPQVDVKDGSIVGAEALLRWNDSLLGNISPARFIPVAEASGQIVALGNYVLDAACRQIALWTQEGTPLRVAVNLSAYQLRQANLVELVHSCLQRHAVDAHWLELEVTESQAMLDSEHAKKVLGQLSQLGVTIALDDFGTGYSSLAYLQYLPVQRVKLGREFLFPSRNRIPIVGGILRMIHSLDLEVVAEGVETQEQLEILQSLDCNYYQGWLHSRAMPAEQMKMWFKPR